MFAPIVLFVYNRPNHTKHTIEALKKNTLAKSSELFVFADGLKMDNKTNREKDFIDVRDFIKTINGFKDVQIIERQENLGLSKSIIFGVTEIIKFKKKVIVLEDDLITSPYFLKYMNDGLNMYEYNPEVISISGWNYPIKKMPESFFIRCFECWGWATWERSWNNFTYDIDYLIDKISSKNLIKDFNFANNYPFFDLLKAQLTNYNSWAIKLYANVIINNSLTLYPSISFIKNIGQDNSGVHCKDVIHKTEKLSNMMKLKKIDIVESYECRIKFERYFKSINNRSFLKKLFKYAKFN